MEIRLGFIAALLFLGMSLLAYTTTKRWEESTETVRTLRDSVMALQAKTDSLQARVRFEETDLEGFRLRCYVREGPDGRR